VLAKWYGRWQDEGDDGLMDHTSRPEHSPAAIGDDIVDAIMELRKREKWGAARIAAHLKEKGIEVRSTAWAVMPTGMLAVTPSSSA
jgi:transposase